MSIILFIVILGALVFVHELGHFLLAKYFGIRVDEFALGFPPHLLSRTIGETTYSLNLVPFGGYVNIFGEDMQQKPPEGPDASRAFTSKNRAVQALVLSGGILANIVFAWVLFSVTFMTGAPVSTESYPGVALTEERLMIVDILPDAPASRAGIKAGDTISSISDEKETVEAPTVEAVQQFIASREGKEISIEIARRQTMLHIKVVPVRGVVDKGAGIGISMDQVGTLKLSFLQGLIEGGKRMGTLLLLTARGIGAFLYQVLTLQADFSSVTGPVGIAVLVGNASSLGWFYILSFTAIISLNLAVINLIPFPALDGGRLFFVLIEAIIRKPLPAKFVQSLNAAGFVILLVLLLFVTYKDVLRLL